MFRGCWDAHAAGSTNHRQPLGALRKPFCWPVGRTLARLPELPHNTRTTAGLRRAGVCSSGQLMKAETTCGCSLIEPGGHSRTLHQHSAPLTLPLPAGSEGFVVEALLHLFFFPALRIFTTLLSSSETACFRSQRRLSKSTNLQRRMLSIQ